MEIKKCSECGGSGNKYINGVFQEKSIEYPCPTCYGTGEKVYIFKREVKAWGVEDGDYYNEQRHMYKGGTKQLLKEGIIEEENIWK